MLKKADDRIYLLNESNLEEFTTLAKTDETFDKDVYIEKLLLENAELKAMFEILNDELAKRLRKGRDMIIEIGKGFFVFHTDIKVLKDNRIKIKKDWEVTIGPDTTFSGKLPGTYRDFNVRCWFVESEGEYTYDPKDETPIEVKKQNEGLLEISHLMAKKNLGAALIEDLGSKIEKWWKFLGPYIIIFMITISFLIFMTQVNIIKS